MAPATDREPKVLLHAGELQDGEREIALKDCVWAPDGKALLFQVDGAFFYWRLADRALRRLTADGTRNQDPRFSPDGSRVAFVREADLWVVEVESAQERRLTQDGAEGRILNGKPDWVYWEEIFNRRSLGFWWSPDGRRIAYLRFEEEGVPTYPLLRDRDVAATVEQQPYPKPGERNPAVRVGVLDLASGETAWMKTGIHQGDDYVARVKFTPGGDALGVIRLTREQDEADLLLCDPASGDCRSKLVERRKTWVDVGDDFELLADGRVLWGSDRDGWWRLWLHDADGRPLRAVSPEGIVVASLERVVEASGPGGSNGPYGAAGSAGAGGSGRSGGSGGSGGSSSGSGGPSSASGASGRSGGPGTTVFFTGWRNVPLGAKDRQLYRVELDGDRVSEAVALSPEPSGTSSSEVAPGGQAWVLTHSTANEPPRAALWRAGDAKPIELPFRAATAYDRASLPRWEFFTIPGPFGTALPARVMKPLGFDPKRRYPVLMHHYGGPASQVVDDASTERPVRDLWHARQAQRGYVIVMADNPASAFFGKNGADLLHRRFGRLELEAQLAVVKWLGQQSWADTARLGLWGWSGGGANTLYSVLESPGTWRAAVAGSPVTDWRLYDSIWTERYLDSPSSNEQGYSDSSAIGKASRLADALLIVHGTGDDNVHPQNTIMMSRELIKAGKQFEQAIYPDEKHGFTDVANRHFYQRMEEFFDRWLMNRRQVETVR
jgi:dipeptidyl-peptidase-4